MLMGISMMRKLKPRIFWTQYPPDHIYELTPKPFPGIVTSWDEHPALDEWENELLWILNNDFNLKAKGASLALSIQKELRIWADRWIENPDIESFSQDITEALQPFHLKFQVTPKNYPRGAISRKDPLLDIRPIPKCPGKDQSPYWLFALVKTLSKVGPKGLGKCEICDTYFIDIKHRGKKRCSLKCSRLASIQRFRAKKGRTPTKG